MAMELFFEQVLRKKGAQIGLFCSYIWYKPYPQPFSKGEGSLKVLKSLSKLEGFRVRLVLNTKY